MNTTEPTTYTLRFAWQVWALFCLGLGVVGIFGEWLVFLDLLSRLSWHPARDLDTLGLILFLCATPLFLALVRHGWHILKIYLVVTPKGLEYHGGGKHIRASWSSLACYGPVNWGGPWPAEGVCLRRHSGTEGIPLDVFAANWPLSPLGQTIHQYAPRLTSQPVAPPLRRRPAITQRLRPLRAPRLRFPGQAPKVVPMRLRDRDTDTVRF